MGRFTWTNCQQPPLLIRLDRFLVTEDWKAHCPALLQVRLKRPISNHTPILLCCNSGIRYKAPFRLDNYLLLHPSFLANLSIWWQNLTFSGRPSYVLAKKLQSSNFFYKSMEEVNGGLAVAG